MSYICIKSSTGTSLRKCAVTAVAVVVLATGCGGSSETITAPNTPKQRAADEVTAKQAVLTAKDLPAGYTGTPHDNSSNHDLPPAVLKKFVTCAKVSFTVPRHGEERPTERRLA